MFVHGSMPYIPTARAAKTAVSWGLLTSQPSLLGGFQANEILSLKNKVGCT